LASAGVALAAARGRSADRLLAALRAGDPIIIGRIEDGRVVVDLRTVPPRLDDDLSLAIGQALAGDPPRPWPSSSGRPVISITARRRCCGRSPASMPIGCRRSGDA